MERHIAKRLGIPCAVISAPVHVQDFPARYSPQMGFEGANVLFDTWVHPLMMGLEEHLLAMFRDDFEFHDDAAPSHLGAAAAAASRRSGGRPRRRPSPGRRGREGAWQDPVLRSRQGAPQHRTLRQRARRRRSSPSRRCTMPKRISAAEATPVRVVVVTMDSHLAGAAARARTAAARRAAGAGAGGPRRRRMGRRRRGAGRLPRRHRARRHRDRHHAVPGRPHPRRAAGAGRAARRVRRDAVLHVGRRGRCG